MVLALEYKNLSEIKPQKTQGSGKHAKTVVDQRMVKKIQKQKEKILQKITSYKPKKKKHKKAGEGVVFAVPKHLQPKPKPQKESG
jgi:hypothetical protein